MDFVLIPPRSYLTPAQMPSQDAAGNVSATATATSTVPGQGSYYSDVLSMTTPQQATTTTNLSVAPGGGGAFGGTHESMNGSASPPMERPSAPSPPDLTQGHLEATIVTDLEIFVPEQTLEVDAAGHDSESTMSSCSGDALTPLEMPPNVMSVREAQLQVEAINRRHGLFHVSSDTGTVQWMPLGVPLKRAVEMKWRQEVLFSDDPLECCLHPAVKRVQNDKTAVVQCRACHFLADAVHLIRVHTKGEMYDGSSLEQIKRKLNTVHPECPKCATTASDPVGTVGTVDVEWTDPLWVSNQIPVVLGGTLAGATDDDGSHVEDASLYKVAPSSIMQNQMQLKDPMEELAKLPRVEKVDDENVDQENTNTPAPNPPESPDAPETATTLVAKDKEEANTVEAVADNCDNGAIEGVEEKKGIDDTRARATPVSSVTSVNVTVSPFSHGFVSSYMDSLVEASRDMSSSASLAEVVHVGTAWKPLVGVLVHRLDQVRNVTELSRLDHMDSEEWWRRSAESMTKILTVEDQYLKRQVGRLVQDTELPVPGAGHVMRRVVTMLGEGRAAPSNPLLSF